MTQKQVEYYKKIGLWGDIIVMSNSVLICTYVMWLEFDTIPNILCEDFKHLTKLRLNQVKKKLDNINNDSISYFREHKMSVGEMCLDFTNSFEEHLNIPNKELYIIYALNEFCNNLNMKFNKHISSIYDKELRFIYIQIKEILSKYIQDNYLNVANTVVRSIMNKVSYRIKDNGEYVITFKGNEIC